MSYSCTDFVDSILDAMKIELEPDEYDDPSAQADLALEHYANLVAQRDAMLAALKHAQEAMAWYNAEGFEQNGRILADVLHDAIKLAEGN